VQGWGGHPRRRGPGIFHRLGFFYHAEFTARRILWKGLGAPSALPVQDAKIFNCCS
jgi:hypothetical protein